MYENFEIEENLEVDVLEIPCFRNEVKTKNGTYIIDTRVPFDSDCYETAVWVETEKERMSARCAIVEIYANNATIDQVKKKHFQWIGFIKKYMPDFVCDVYLDKRIAITKKGWLEEIEDS